MRFEDLDVWKRAARLSADIYKSLRTLKDFGYRDQITRSGLSIASNIAEGYERESDKDRVKFLSYAKGSCGELRTQIYIGMEADYVDTALGKRWLDETPHDLSDALRIDADVAVRESIGNKLQATGHKLQARS